MTFFKAMTFILLAFSVFMLVLNKEMLATFYMAQAAMYAAMESWK